ncbi:MAG: nucleotidyltransferase family protein [Candidatus Liptonbacteria bacterium]|nr:nucleotidyltransferase family protein [Candidatus Liptonbacteria bacterium]
MLYAYCMQNRITQAVIAAGGMGTRLRPTTDTIPKVMIPILGKPMLEWHVEQFKKHGVKEFFFTLQYLPDVTTSYFGDGSKWGVKINYFVEKEPLGSAGGIKAFERQLNDEFFFIYGDTFSLVDYTKMVESWAKKPADALGMQRMKKTQNYADADVAELDADGKYVAIHTKPHSAVYPNAYRMRGVFIMRKEILKYVPENTKYDLGKKLLPDIVAKNLKFYSYECGDYSKGIDTLEKWKEVEENIKKLQVEEKA